MTERLAFDRWRLDCHNALRDLAIARGVPRREYEASARLGRKARHAARANTP